MYYFRCFDEAFFGIRSALMQPQLLLSSHTIRITLQTHRHTSVCVLSLTHPPYKHIRCDVNKNTNSQLISLCCNNGCWFSRGNRQQLFFKREKLNFNQFCCLTERRRDTARQREKLFGSFYKLHGTIHEAKSDKNSRKKKLR